jgi:hypothetical protein
MARHRRRSYPYREEVADGLRRPRIIERSRTNVPPKSRRNKDHACRCADLCHNQIIGSRDIEYKQTVDLGPTADVKRKIKLLAGISSFANTDGANFLVGIRAVNGIPQGATPIERDKLDRISLQLSSWCRLASAHESHPSCERFACLTRTPCFRSNSKELGSSASGYTSYLAPRSAATCSS